MTKRFLRTLLDEASRPFQGGGHFAYHYSRGKLSSDSIFREILKRGLFPAEAHYLDLGCGQGSLFSWLLAARKLYEAGNWPKDWPAAPKALSLRGIELMQKDVDRAAKAFGLDHPSLRIEQGDMTKAEFGKADVITILDALHYFDHADQKDVIRRIRAALPPGGLFLTRVGDASAGLPYHLCNWVDHAVTFVRGHRLPRLYCRPLAEWIALLESFGFTVETDPMNDIKPFANVMLVCRVPA
ncbi:MAG: methyltransferase domain-containing protein [Dechloromonas sp.]|nr:methyltransferase domain-containing protein [Dechloromonas sp.]